MSIAALLAASAIAGTASAQSGMVQVEIPPGRLDQALIALSREAGQQIFFAKTLLHGRTTPGLRGQYTADEAMTLLLRDSGLTFSRSNAGVWMILAEPPVRKVAANMLVAEAAPAAATPAAAAAATAPPSDTPAANGAAIEEVVVTARRREENLQSVPVAVTAFSAQALADHNVTDVVQLGQLTPSLNFNTSPYGLLGVNVSVRGQMPTDTDITQTPSIGVYVDDVYQASTMGLGALGLADAASVEVLKGPQGTLYGRNTTGGALKVTTQLPDYDEASGVARVGYGNQHAQRAYGAVSAPILPGRVALRLAANFEKDRGYGHDIQNDVDIADMERRAVRAALRVKVTDNFEMIARADTLVADAGPMLYVLADARPGGALNIITAFQLGLPLDPVGLGRAYDFLRANYINEPGRERRYNGPPYQHIVQTNQSLSLRYDVNEALSLKSVTAFAKVKNNIAGDNDATPFRTIDGNFDNQYISQTTQEFQATGILLEDRLNYTVGYFYYRNNGLETSFANVLFPLQRQQIHNNNRILNKSNAGYAQATFKVAPQLRLTGGLRYTKETTDLTSRNALGFPTGDVCNIPFANRIAGECRAVFANRDSDWSYTAGVDWDALDDVLVYAKTSRGFKAGGVNQRGTVNGGFNTFLPEQVTDYELGFKSQFWDRRARLNVAVYHSKYDNIQRTVIVAGAAGAPATAVQNAASAKINGVEAELTVRPIPALTFSAGGAYTHGKYDTYVDPLSGADLSYRELGGTPRWQGTLSAVYEQPLSIGSVRGSLDLAYRSRVNFDPDNNIPPGPGLPQGTEPFTTQRGNAVLNGRVDLNVDSADMTFSVWARNLANKRYLSGARDFGPTLGLTNQVLAEPRTYGIEVTKRF